MTPASSKLAAGARNHHLARRIPGPLQRRPDQRRTHLSSQRVMKKIRSRGPIAELRNYRLRLLLHCVITRHHQTRHHYEVGCQLGCVEPRMRGAGPQPVPAAGVDTSATAILPECSTRSANTPRNSSRRSWANATTAAAGWGMRKVTCASPDNLGLITLCGTVIAPGLFGAGEQRPIAEGKERRRAEEVRRGGPEATPRHTSPSRGPI